MKERTSSRHLGQLVVVGAVVAWSVTWEPRIRTRSATRNQQRKQKVLLYLMAHGGKDLIKPEGGKLISKVGGREGRGGC